MVLEQNHQKRCIYENWWLQFSDFYRFLHGSFDKSTTTLTYFLFLYVNGIEDELLNENLAYPYEKGEIIESFYETLKSGREDNFPLWNLHIQFLKK